MSEKIFEKLEVINIFGETVEQEKEGALLEKFLMPPFSVFDTKQGYWQDRKRLWQSLGIKSEIGRGDNLTFNLDSFDYETDKKIQELKKFGKCLPGGFDEEKYGITMKAQATSIFDPALCEVVYKWFNVDGGTIYDCFAGGSVRGIVAEKLKYKYVGIDLRQEQVDANIENAKELNVNPTWHCDDSMNVDKYLKDDSVDLVFSCPPYLDLEVYSDHPADLSNMEYEQFKVAYIKIIERACAKLKQDRFAVFVVGDVRDKDGFYRNFVDLTKYAFHKAGLKTYNEIILLNALGTAMIRAGKPFTANRKLTKVHQNVLVFYKGNPKNIRENYKALELDY